MFKIDDYIVYGGSGVCKVIDVGVPEISSFSGEREYYTLKPLYEDETIYTPVDNTRVLMREVISKEEANELISSIPTIEVDWIPNIKDREEKYKNMMKNSDCEDFLRIIKEVSCKKQELMECGKKLSAIDTKYLKEAKEHLFGEFAVAIGIPKDDVDDYIRNSIKSIVIN